MRIIILHPAVPPDATLEDQDSLVQVEAIAAAITRLGWQPLPMPCTLDLAALRQNLLISRGDALISRGDAVVFNLVESLDVDHSIRVFVNVSRPLRFSIRMKGTHRAVPGEPSGAALLGDMATQGIARFSTLDRARPSLQPALNGTLSGEMGHE